MSCLWIFPFMTSWCHCHRSVLSAIPLLKRQRRIFSYRRELMGKVIHATLTEVLKGCVSLQSRNLGEAPHFGPTDGNGQTETRHMGLLPAPSLFYSLNVEDILWLVVQPAVDL